MLDRPLREVLDSFAARTSTPGGGSAAALAGALGVALLLMALRFSLGRKNAPDQPAVVAAERELAATYGLLLPLAEEDARAFGRIAQARALPRGSDAERAARDAALQAALRGAMAVPQRILELCHGASACAGAVRDLVNPNLLPDLDGGQALLAGAAQGATLNVLANARLLPPPAEAEATAFCGRHQVR